MIHFNTSTWKRIGRLALIGTGVLILIWISFHWFKKEPIPVTKNLNVPLARHELKEAPLITYEEAYKNNRWQQEKFCCWITKPEILFADTTQTILKTLVMDYPLNALTTAIVLVNDIKNKRGPILLNYSTKLFHKVESYYFWKEHDVKSAKVSVSPKLQEWFDYSYGLNEVEKILPLSYPIEIRDTSIFKELIRLEYDGKMYSPLFECLFRKETFLISGFDPDSLQEEPLGCHFWDIIRNYTYSDEFRKDIPNNRPEVSRDAWIETLIPWYKSRYK